MVRLTLINYVEVKISKADAKLTSQVMSEPIDIIYGLKENGELGDE
jgi:hypothetical protein